ncbi:exosome complex exonuclease RRP45 [Magnaporthiopsis poae ATCC 64411]|uniref:Exosome complex component RRP45 n=1 Tax=Magnaporthiopsis poae (strain ATCC 64411 / 73-15) TaxID=644358 RepID=A0A0C4E741_MAGP6|nr:exosome complex exonuclease RRP45 [Magnaporthiopsis poae ATCC 64411]
MPREAEPSLNEKAFVLQALQQNLRLDGREVDQYRPIKLNFGDEYGVVDVELGKTRILAKTSAEVTVPYADRPFDGIFNIVTELSPMASPAFEVNRPTEAEVLLSRLLEKTVRRSGALDTESLCLIAGQKCWSVRVDLHVLSHDGNLVDASCLAVVTALRHFRKPDTSIEGEALTVYTPAEREPVPLSWLHSPFCITFSFFGESVQSAGGDDDPGDLFAVDANWLEEQVRVGHCTISLNRHGEICQISKLGGAAVDAVALLQCNAIALAKAKDLSKLVDDRLAEDAKKRDKGGLLAELSAENAR